MALAVIVLAYLTFHAFQSGTWWPVLLGSAVGVAVALVQNAKGGIDTRPVIHPGLTYKETTREAASRAAVLERFGVAREKEEKGNRTREPKSVLGTVSSPSPTEAQSSPQGTTSSSRTINGTWIGCVSRDDFRKFLRYLEWNDRDAFHQACAEGIASGQCVWLLNGQEVEIVDTQMYSGLVQIRREGELKEFWTAYDAICR